MKEKNSTEPLYSNDKTTEEKHNMCPYLSYGFNKSIWKTLQSNHVVS